MPGERKRQKLGGPDQATKSDSKPPQKKAPSSSTRGGTRGESRPSSSRIQNDRMAGGNAATAPASTIPSTALAQAPVKLNNHQKFRLQVLVARNTDVPSHTQARQGQVPKVNWTQIHGEFVDQFDDLSSNIQDESAMANIYYMLQDQDQSIPTAQSEFQEQTMGGSNMPPTTVVHTGTSYPNEAEDSDIDDEGNDMRARSGRRARSVERDVAEQVSRMSISGDDDVGSTLRDRDQSTRTQRGREPQSRTRGVATGMRQSIAGSDSSHHGLGGRDLRTTYVKDKNTGVGALSATAAKRGSKKEKRNDNLEGVIADLSSDFTELSSNDSEFSFEDEAREGGGRKPKVAKIWGFDGRHVDKVIQLHQSLWKSGSNLQNTGIWKRIAENFCEEFPEFAGKPGLELALCGLGKRTRKSAPELAQNSIDSKRLNDKRFQWDVPHIDFLEDAVARDLPWKVIHKRFLEKFPEMRHRSERALKAAHKNWSYVRQSVQPKLLLWGCMNAGLSPEEKMKLIRARQQHSALDALPNEVIRSMRVELSGPDVSEEQIEDALTGHIKVPLDEMMQNLAHRKAEVDTQKARRVERNSNSEKELAKFNRQRVHVWIKMYKIIEDGRTSQAEAARQLLKCEEFRQVYKIRKTKGVSTIYHDLKKQGVTMKYLQEILAAMDAGKSAETLIDAINAIDGLGPDSETRNDDVPVGDDDDDTLFVPDDRQNPTLPDGQEGESAYDVEMRVYQQQIRLRAHLGGKSADDQEASIEARVHQQQLQARLDIEILTRPSLDTLEMIDIMNGEAYKNWLQLGDNVSEDVFEKLAERNHQAVYAMLEERSYELEERNVGEDELKDIAKLSILHHDYLTLWEDADPYA